MNSRRLFFYIIINIIVSASVVGTVLYYYDRSHHVECPNVVQNNMAVSSSTGNKSINIMGVLGTGSITEERIVIQNNGTVELQLAGWYLADNKGLVYVFPQLMLAPGSKVQVHSNSGQDSPTDLYWGRSEPVWSSGELVAIYDTNAIVRAFYRVP